jgi:hypothetical protein
MTMIAPQRKALLVTIALVSLVNNAIAFIPSSDTNHFIHRPLHVGTAIEQNEDTIAPTTPEPTAEAPMSQKKLIMDIPPTPTKKSSTVPKHTDTHHKEGPLSPLVHAASTILGDERLNKVRAKVISYHSDIIKSFIDASESSRLGHIVLQELFHLADTKHLGYLDREELDVALHLLGFKWLTDKHVEKIFERADLNGDGIISLEEFLEEAPKTLRVNLVKLAKNNGGDLGLLV